MRAYAQSKLANILFTRELARRLSGSGVAAYSVHPGTVRTGFAREDAGRLFSLVLRAGALLMKSPEQGAQTSVYAASSPELVGRTGSTWPSHGSPSRVRVLSTTLPPPGSGR